MKKIIFVFTVVFLCQNVNSQNGFCFNPFQQYSIQSYGQSIAAADFNGDGQLDICYESNQGFKILLSTGNGSYSATNSFIVGGMDFVSSADFNNDGKADVAAINKYTDKVYIMLGNGTGSLSLPALFQVDSVPYDLVISDLNSDGNVDIATANLIHNTVSILLGTGTGSFQPAVNYSVGTNPYLIVAGDFNNNGKMDLYVVSTNSTSILNGNGLGTFTVINGPGITTNKILAVDVNSDTKVDLVYSDIPNTKVNVLQGNGNFTFGNPQSYSLTGAWSMSTISTGDYNSDGYVDLLANSGNSICIFPGTTSGFLSTPVSYQLISSGIPIFFMLSADMNGDGKMDVVASQDNTPGKVNVLLNCNTVGVGIAEEKADNSTLVLFPNPVNDFLSLEFSSENDFNTISIYNNLTQLLLEKEVATDDKKIKISTVDLAEGVYFIKLKSVTKGTVTKRFAISR